MEDEKFAKSPGIGQTSTWDPDKTRDCTDKPPKFEDPNTCTPKGCTKPIWYIDGKVCGYTSTEFKDCKDAKTTAACKAETEKKAAEVPPWTTPTISGDQLPNCDAPVWFVDGNDVGSAMAWQKLVCKKNIEAKQDTNWTDDNAPSPIDQCVLDDGSPRQFYFCKGEDKKDITAHAQCIREKKIDECKDDIDKKRESGFNGKYTHPTQGPPPCGKTVWFCNKTQQETEDEYLQTSCGQVPEEPSCTPYTGTPAFCGWGGGWRNHAQCIDFCWD